jgi:hypothetical protein
MRILGFEREALPDWAESEADIPAVSQKTKRKVTDIGCFMGWLSNKYKDV